MGERIAASIRAGGTVLIRLIEHLGLLVVLGAVLVAATQEVMNMVRAGHVSIADLLLLFIYLELVTMSLVYWSVGRLPVRMPMYIAIVALARHLIVQSDDAHSGTLLAEGATILLLSVAVLVVRFGHTRFPYKDESHDIKIS